MYYTYIECEMCPGSPCWHLRGMVDESRTRTTVSMSKQNGTGKRVPIRYVRTGPRTGAHACTGGELTHTDVHAHPSKPYAAQARPSDPY